MPVFACEKCKCMENTALSPYASRNMSIWPESHRGKMLCSECASPVYASGEPSEYGVWHGRFEKRSAVGYHLDQMGFLWSPEQVKAGLLPEHYKIVGIVTE